MTGISAPYHKIVQRGKKGTRARKYADNKTNYNVLKEQNIRRISLHLIR